MQQLNYYEARKQILMTNTTTPSRQLILRARITERRRAVVRGIADGWEISRLAELQRSIAQDEDEYRQLIKNQS